jgi:glycogen(starch) synthase
MDKADNPRSLRVLMTADTVGGVWTYALQLAKALSPHGVTVSLATMGSPLNREQWQEASRLPNVEVFQSSYRLEWMSDPWSDVAAAGEWLLELEERTQPDIVHLNGYAHGALPWRAPALIVGHSCVLSWWRAVHQTAAPPEWNQYRETVARGLRAAHLVIAPTCSMLSALSENYGLLPSTKVIPNGRQLADSVDWPKQKLILAAGRLWDGAKNIAKLDEVAPKLRWPVFVAGERAAPEGQPAPHTHVNYLGRLSAAALVAWFDRASIYALPARYEPFGLSVLEAALAGCALVLGDIPSLRELWDGAALFVPPDDKSALIHALNSLADSPERIVTLAQKARAAAGRFTPEHMAEQYLAAYNELVAHAHTNPELEAVTA